MHVEDLLATDLKRASERVCSEVVPDVAAALDHVLPLAIGGDRMAVRRYVAYVDETAKALTSLPAINAQELPPAELVYTLLSHDTVEFAIVAPTHDGVGIVTALVDRLRGFAGGLPQECVRAPTDFDQHRFLWFVKTVGETVRDREQSSPLMRAMETLDLSATEVGELMGVTRQSVDKWCLGSPPAARALKIGAVAEISEILRHRLRDGLPASVVRRPADAYGGKSMLDLIEEDKHEWLLNSVRESFDYGRVA